MLAGRILMLKGLARFPAEDKSIMKGIPTPEKDNEESLGEALVGPVEGGWVRSVLLLYYPGVDPGGDVYEDDVEEAGALVSIPRAAE